MVLDDGITTQLELLEQQPSMMRHAHRLISIDFKGLEPHQPTTLWNIDLFARAKARGCGISARGIKYLEKFPIFSNRKFMKFTSDYYSRYKCNLNKCIKKIVRFYQRARPNHYKHFPIFRLFKMIKLNDLEGAILSITKYKKKKKKQLENKFMVNKKQLISTENDIVVFVILDQQFPTFSIQNVIEILCQLTFKKLLICSRTPTKVVSNLTY
ncbi:hypothetical protein GQR58_018892 [Nymphon striatum]|nr:hypothetical protein GQR58_018892 [Nymphon striatum]